MIRLLALDPGRTTGYSIWHYDEHAPLKLIQRGQISNGLEGFVAWFRSQERFDEVVAETFKLDGRTIKPDTTPLAIEGALTVLAPGWVGQPNTMKTSATDTQLKRWGLWWPGHQHARDSARHAIAYMKRKRHIPTLRLLFPDRKGSA